MKKCTYKFDKRGMDENNKGYDEYWEEIDEFADDIMKKNPKLYDILDSLARGQIFEMIKNLKTKPVPETVLVGGINLGRVVHKLIEDGYIDADGNY